MIWDAHNATRHLYERVLSAFAGENVTGHLPAHAACQISDVYNFLNFAAAFAGYLAHFHGNKQSERLDVLGAKA